MNKDGADDTSRVVLASKGLNSGQPKSLSLSSGKSSTSSKAQNSSNETKFSHYGN